MTVKLVSAASHVPNDDFISSQLAEKLSQTLAIPAVIRSWYTNCYRNWNPTKKFALLVHFHDFSWPFLCKCHVPNDGIALHYPIGNYDWCRLSVSQGWFRKSRCWHVLDRLLFVPTFFHGLDFRAFQPWQLSFAMLFAMLHVTAPLRLNRFPPNWVRGAESIWIIPSVPTPKYPAKAGWQLPRRIESTMLHSRSPRRDSREGSCKASSSGFACASRGRPNIIRRLTFYL